MGYCFFVDDIFLGSIESFLRGVLILFGGCFYPKVSTFEQLFVSYE